MKKRFDPTSHKGKNIARIAPILFGVLMAFGHGTVAAQDTTTSACTFTWDGNSQVKININPPAGATQEQKDQLQAACEAALLGDGTSKGWYLTTAKTGTGTVSSTTQHKIMPDDMVTLTAGDNMAITQAGANVTIATKPDVTFNSVKVGPVTITQGGINAGDTKITGVADGIISADSTDAVNGSQLYAVQQTAEMGWNLTASGLNSSTVKPGNTVDFNNVDGNVLVYKTADANAVTIDLAPVLSIGTTPVKIDGVTGVITGLTNTTLDVTGFATLGRAATEEQLKFVHQSASAGWNLQANGGPATNIAPNATVNVLDGSNTTAVVEGNTLKINVVDNPTFSGPVTMNGGTTISNNLTVNTGAVVDMGGNKVTNVAPGEISATSKDAVNGSQLFQTNQAIANINNRYDELDKEARAGTASAMAVAGLPQAYLPGKSMVAMSGATYRGATGVALGVSTITDNGKWVLKGAVNSNNKGHVGATIGAGYQW